MSYKEDVKQLLPGLSKKIFLWSAVQRGSIGTQYAPTILTVFVILLHTPVKSYVVKWP